MRPGIPTTTWQPSATVLSTSCDHAPEIARLNALVTSLRAERASALRELAAVKRHALLIEDSRLELQRLAEVHEAREHTPAAGAPRWHDWHSPEEDGCE
jgi:hypothetical protein